MKNKNIKGSVGVIVGVIIVAVVLMGLVLFKGYQKNNNTPSSVAPMVEHQVTSGDNSNDTLDKDLQSVNSNLNTLDKDSNNINDGLNQKAVDPTQ